MRLFTTVCLLLFFSFSAFNQTKQRKLGPALNNPSFNYWAPFISLDGNTILFTYDYTDDKIPAAVYSLRQGVDWKEPVLIPRKFVANSLTKGLTLSPDGKTMYITTTYGGSSGGFDISMSQFNGSTFTDPFSIGAPINSSSNDGCPTFSPDGNTIYFMRCAKMTANTADECKIFTSKKKNGQWSAPIELPPSINAGNSQMPRIMADGQTLVFSSNRHTPNKGGMDLYLSKLSDGQWGAPVNLNFVNTPQDDIYASATSIGNSLLKDAPGERRSELVEFTFPAELKPKATVRVIGVVDGLADLTKSNVNIINLETKQLLYGLQPDAKGNFICYIPEGNLYGLFVEPPSENFKFFEKQYDLTAGNKVPNFDRVAATLKPLGPGDEIELSGVSFKPFSSEITSTSVVDLQKLSKMMRGNPALSFNIDVTLFGYVKDSIQSEDLTEVVPDTVVYQKEFQIDSVTTEIRDSLAVEYQFHNDRTPKQAQAIADFIIKQGVRPEKISITFKAFEEPLAERRKTVIYLKVR